MPAPKSIRFHEEVNAGGKYEMATIEHIEGVVLNQATVRQVVTEAIALNHALGNPTQLSASQGK